MKVLVADPIADDGIELLKKHADVEVKLKMTPEELLEIIGDYEGVVVRSERSQKNSKKYNIAIYFNELRQKDKLKLEQYVQQNL